MDVQVHKTLFDPREEAQVMQLRTPSERYQAFLRHNDVSHSLMGTKPHQFRINFNRYQFSTLAEPELSEEDFELFVLYGPEAELTENMINKILHG